MQRDFYSQQNTWIMNTRLHFENLTSLVFAFLALLFLLFSYGFYLDNSIEEDMEEDDVIDVNPILKAENSETLQLGKTLFKNNCASCHAKNMKIDLTGPALEGVNERWENKEDLYAWIRNSQAFLTTGDEYANALFLKWRSPMIAFPNLSDKEIEAILEYVEVQSGK